LTFKRGHEILFNDLTVTVRVFEALLRNVERMVKGNKLKCAHRILLSADVTDFCTFNVIWFGKTNALVADRGKLKQVPTQMQGFYGFRHKKVSECRKGEQG